MFLLNQHPDHGAPLPPNDAAALGSEAADAVMLVLEEADPARYAEFVPGAAS